jgi:hypothetical protein
MTRPLLRGLVVGEFGKVNSLVCKDFDGNIENLSGYTGTKTAVILSPDSKKTITCTASFFTDGSEGNITFSFSSGNTPDREGLWSGQIELSCSSALAKTYPFDLEIERELR